MIKRSRNHEIISQSYVIFKSRTLTLLHISENIIIENMLYMTGDFVLLRHNVKLWLP